MKLLRQLKARFGRGRLSPLEAYDLWADSYDEQPDNLMFCLDGEAMAELAQLADLRDKRLLDMGCGTGRHWPLFLRFRPKSLIGCDISPAMLARLQGKFPGAATRLVKDARVSFQADASIDVVISTLTLGHIADPEPVLADWSRILAPGGCLLISEFHPEALMRGAERSFSHAGRTLRVRNYPHPLADLRRALAGLGLREIGSRERVVDASMADWYAGGGSMETFRAFLGTPIYFALLARKAA